MFVILMTLGSLTFVSIFVVLIRRHYFRQKLKEIVEHSASGRKILEDIERQESKSVDKDKADVNASFRKRRQGLSKASVMSPEAPARSQRRSVQVGMGTLPAPWEIQGFRKFFQRPFRLPGLRLQKGHASYLSFDPRVDDRGRVHALNEHERAELGGVEYRALEVLMWALPIYQIFWMLLGTLLLVPYSYRPSMKATLATAQPGNLNPGFWGFFAVSTSFANCGLNPINENFIPFRGYYLVLIVSAVVTYAGNTQFPIFFRFGLWLARKSVPKDSRLHHSLRFLLHHPRRCFIYLFPARETWILFAIQVGIDLLLWVSFGVLNIGLAPVTEAIPVRPRIIDGLFQATGVRTSGAYIIVVSALAPALLVVYLVFIYVSNFPIIMALRQTNLYEERSVGLDPNHGQGGGLAIHLRNQLAYDVWFQLVAWCLIAIIERAQITGGAQGFTLFTILFEVTSAYGTVGLSTGVPYDNYSLCGQFHVMSKLILIVVMLRGRHRGLPLAIDRSILLPGEKLMNKMDEEYSQYGKFSPEEEERLRRDEEESGVKEVAHGEGKNLVEQDPEEASSMSSQDQLADEKA